MTCSQPMIAGPSGMPPGTAGGFWRRQHTFSERIIPTTIAPMGLRIAFDLDGVLADMSAALKLEELRLFGAPEVEAVEENAPAVERVSESLPETEPDVEADGDTEQVTAEMAKHGLSARQTTRVWRSVVNIENFWETLDEIEPGAVQTLAELAASRRWEMIFLTRRPGTAGHTSQVQTQRWLQRHGFPMPSVFVVNGSRGKIADALGLDVVVDDTPSNCVDVLSDSKAKTILIWRDSSDTIPAGARRVGIGVVSSVAECLEVLVGMDEHVNRPAFLDRVKWALGLAARK